MRAQRAKIRPETAVLNVSMAKGGGTEGRKDGRTDVWKFPPVSHRTSALWGRCPKSCTECLQYRTLESSIK